jgi:Fur family ferric uptake transcriptional regulator
MKKEVSSQDLEVLSKHLKDNGLKNTHQREVIFEIFLRSEEHLSIEDLLAKVREVDSNIGYATVYRNLQILQDCGLASKLEFEGQSLFEKAGKHHDHLICIKCGKISEFENEEIENIQEKVAKDLGYQLLSHKHELYGKCSRCQ